MKWIPATLAAFVVFIATAEARAQRYVTTDFSLNQVDVGRLTQRLGRLGIQIPFTLDGLVTTNITIGVPWTTLGTTQNYRLDGTLTSDRLVVSGVELREVDATLVYRDGVMHLRPLRFRMPDEGEDAEAIAGLFTGNASLELVPIGDAEFNLTLDRIPLRPLAGQFADLPEIAGGRMSGRLTGTVPANQTGEIGAWSARGEATIVGLDALGVTFDSASARFALDEALLTMSDLTGRIGDDISFSGAGTLRLESPFEQTAELAINVRDAGALRPLAPDLPWPENVDGTIRLTASASGTLEPMEIEASGRLIAESLRAGPLAITSIAANYASDGEMLRISDLVASLYGGELTGTASVPLASAGLLEIDVRWRELDLAPLASGLEFTPIDARELDGGAFAGTLTAAIPVQSWNDPAQWRMGVAATVTGAEAGDLPVQRARVEARIDDGVLTVPVLDARIAEMRLAGDGRVDLTADYAYAADLQIERLMLGDAARLPEPLRPPVRVGGRINLTGELEGTLQPLTITGAGTVSATDLVLKGLAADTASFLWSADGDALHVRDLDMRLYRGSLTGRASVPLSPNVAGCAALGWRGIELAPFLRAARPHLPEGLVPEDVAGIISGQVELEIPRGQQHDVRRWMGTARATITGGRAGDWDIRSLTADVRLADQTLNLTRIAGQIAGATLSGSGRLGLAAPHPYAADLSLAGRGLDVSRLGEHVPLAVRIAGPYEVHASATGNLQPLQIAGNGHVLAGGVRLGEVDVEMLEARWEADGRTFELSPLSARVAGGQVSGSAVVPLVENVAGSAALQWEEVALVPFVTTVARVWPELPAISAEQIAGRLRGRVDVAVPAGAIQDVAAWEADAELELADGRVFGWNVERFSAAAELRERVLRLTELDGRFGETSVAGSARLQLAAPHEYTAELQLNDGDLEKLNALPAEWRLPFPASGDFNLSADVNGTLEPLHARGQGSVAARNVLLARLSVPRLDLDWSAEGERLEITRLEAQIAGGEARGEATLPLVPTASGRAMLRWNRVELAQIASLLDDLPVEVAGTVAGELNATIPAARAGGERIVSARSTVTSPELTLGPLDIARLEGAVELAENIAQYRFDGATLDGTFEAEGTLDVRELRETSSDSARAPVAPPVPDALAATKVALAEPVPHGDSGTSETVDRGTMRLRGISLSALAAAADMNVEAIEGTLDAALRYEHTSDDGLPAGRGTFDLTALRWRDLVVSERVQGALTWRGTRVFLDGLTGRIAGGELRASANLDLEEPSRSTLQIALRGARSTDLEGFLPDVPLPVAGNLDLAFRVALGARWRAIGRVALPQGRLDGVRLGSLQIPLSIIHDPRTGSTIVEMRESAAQFARGRITGTARAVQDRTLALQADLKFSGLDLQTVLRQLGTRSRFGRGQISGRMTLEGRNVTSSADLNGRIDATLRNIEPRSVPVVSALVPYLSGGVSAYSRIDEGELRARISSGNLVIQRFTLDGRALQLFAEGTISRTGRLNLDVVANTNVLGTNRFAAQALLDRLPPIGPPPVVALVQANRFLSNRVVYLRVSGTIRRPVVRIRPVPQLREQMIRFFLSQSAAG